MTGIKKRTQAASAEEVFAASDGDHDEAKGDLASKLACGSVYRRVCRRPITEMRLTDQPDFIREADCWPV